MSDHIPQLSTTSSSSSSSSSTSFANLSIDLTAHILSLLPIPTILLAAAVCKSWHSIISHPTFTNLHYSHKQPWFFLLGLHNISSKYNQSFAFDPSSNSWFRLPLLPSSSSSSSTTTPTSSVAADSDIQRSMFSFQGSNGFFFTTNPHFSFTPILKTTPRLTSPLKFSRIYPLIGVFNDNNNNNNRNNNHDNKLSRFIVVGGVSFVGNLVDIEDTLAVEIYDPYLDTWELCPPLPSDFRSGNSARLSSAMFKNKFYVYGIHSSFVSAFDLHKRVWSEVQTLRPPGVMFSFLIACQNQLVLAGMCNNPAPRGGPTFNLWRVDEGTMEFSEIAIMPQNLLYSLVDGEEEDNSNKFASLKCVGLGNLIYVFNEEYHKRYPACVCEISSDSGNCRWRRLPKLPSPVNKFHKVISFCSTVCLQNL